MGESFQRRTGSVSRAANRLSCSFRDTENQNLMMCVPELESMRSSSGVSRMNSRYCWGVQ